MRKVRETRRVAAPFRGRPTRAGSRLLHGDAHPIEGHTHRSGLGRNQEAVDSRTQATVVAPGDPFALTLLAWALGLAGRPEEGLTIRSKLEERRADEYVSGFLMALSNVGLDDTEQAIWWLHRAEEERDPNLATLRTMPGMDPLRAVARPMWSPGTGRSMASSRPYPRGTGSG